MKHCMSCGNDYEPMMEISLGGEVYHFDCFECAINLLAPACHHCGVRIIGHGVASKAGAVFCCSHCQKTDEASNFDAERSTA